MLNCLVTQQEVQDITLLLNLLSGLGYDLTSEKKHVKKDPNEKTVARHLFCCGFSVKQEFFISSVLKLSLCVKPSVILLVEPHIVVTRF